jgi:hypothetical protein
MGLVVHYESTAISLSVHWCSVVETQRSRLIQTIYEYYYRSVAVLLVATLAGKIALIAFPMPVLEEIDLLLGIKYRTLTILVILAEAALLIGIRCLRSNLYKCLLIAALGWQFVLYRLMTKLHGMPQPCPCLGRLTDIVPVPKQYVEVLLWGIAQHYAVIGGALAIVAAIRLIMRPVCNP